MDSEFGWSAEKVDDGGAEGGPIPSTDAKLTLFSPPTSFEIHSGADSDTELLPLFCPDAYIPPDVPPAPPSKDFPLGCHVHLRGEQRLQLVQGERYWGDLQQLLACTTRFTKITVVRHSGDYTFVLCDDDPNLVVGCSVHRAALTDPIHSMRPKKVSASTEGLSHSTQRRFSNESLTSLVMVRGRVSEAESALHYYEGGPAGK